MATLDDRIKEIKEYYGDRLLKWEPLGYPTDSNGNPTDGRYSYKVYFKDANDPNVMRTDIIQINVINKGTADEEAYWENRNYITNITPSFHEIVKSKVDAKVLDGTFKHAEVITTDEKTRRAIIKVIKPDVSGNNQSMYFIVTFDEDNNVISTEQTNY